MERLISNATGAAGPAGAQGPAGLPVVAAGSNQITVNGVFCGITGPTTGNFSDPTGSGAKGYRAAKLACQQVASCGPSATAHMCDNTELMRSAQLGVLPPSPFPAGNPGYWYGTFATSYNGTNGTYGLDCVGWTDGTTYYNGAYVFFDSSRSALYPASSACITSLAIACCK